MGFVFGVKRPTFFGVFSARKVDKLSRVVIFSVLSTKLHTLPETIFWSPEAFF